MKRYCLILVVALSAGLFAETVTKSSAPFAFPATVNVREGRSMLNSDASFVAKAHFTGRKAITFSWSLPSKAKHGVISIFSIDGSRIAWFAITSAQGNLQWDVWKNTPAANGIYLATLTYGPYKRDCKVVIYR